MEDQLSSRWKLLHAFEHNLRQSRRLFTECRMLPDVAFNAITITLEFSPQCFQLTNEMVNLLHRNF